jgi:hypothetical protein
MQPEDMRLIVQTVEARGVQTPSLLPATVVGFETGASVVSLAMDGDPADSIVEALPLFSDFSNGDRVMVMFDPPQGVYVVGRIGVTSGEPKAGEIFKYYESDIFALTYTNTSEIAFSESSLSLLEGRMYRVDLHLFASWVDGYTGCQITAITDSYPFPPLRKTTTGTVFTELGLNFLEGPYAATGSDFILTHGTSIGYGTPFNLLVGMSYYGPEDTDLEVECRVKMLITDVGIAPPLQQDAP